MESSVRTKGRKYGFACLICRRRKIKCDGRKPTCINCARSKETCSYKEHTAFTIRLGEELQTERARVHELESHIKELADLDNSARDRRLEELLAQLKLNRPQQDNGQPASSPASPSVFGSADGQAAVDDVCYDGGAQFSVDNDGKVLKVQFCLLRSASEALLLTIHSSNNISELPLASMLCRSMEGARLRAPSTVKGLNSGKWRIITKNGWPPMLGFKSPGRGQPMPTYIIIQTSTPPSVPIF